MKRFFFNFSHDTELDSAHRVMIPQQLLDYAGLDKEVVWWDRANASRCSTVPATATTARTS